MRIALLMVLLVPSAFSLLTRERAVVALAAPPLEISSEQLDTAADTHKPQHGQLDGAISIYLYPSNRAATRNEIDRRELYLHNQRDTSSGKRVNRTRRTPLDEISALQPLTVDQQAAAAAAAAAAPRNGPAPSEAEKCAHHTPAILGIRCDQGGDVHKGILVVMANEPTELMLIGRNFDANISVALTPESNSARADCTHADRVRSQSFLTISSNIARIVIDVPPPRDEPKPYYLCVRDLNGRWWHQGADTWLQLYVKEDFLPVYMKIIVVAVLLMLSGLFSGLNLGLMALDKNELQVIISCGSDTEKRYARAIEPVRRRGNYLLCSILFSNVLVNSTIAVLLEELTSGIVAVMTSTIFIVMFGEILPQAFCSRHGLAVGAKTVSITYFCMIVTFPLSYPVSSCLDWALGEEIGHAYDRERLMEFIRVTRDYNNLETDEVNIIQGALKLKRIPLSEVMTRIEDVFMLDLSANLDFETIQTIIERGYSRVPVHEPANKKNIVALLFAKDLALLDPDDRTPVRTLINFYNHPIMYLFEDETLDLALDEFKTGKSHMAFVRRVIDDGDRDPIYEITGVVTLEDVIEEIMQMEINDETDILSDNKRKRRRNEAQVRRDFAQFSHFGAGQSSCALVSPQLCLAAYQYLATTCESFSAKFLSDLVLKRLMSQKIYYRARLDHGDNDDDDEDERRKRKLYKAGEPAEHFIMILEGRVRVVCGREALAFEAGPFSYFGKAALQVPATCAEQPDTPATLQEHAAAGKPSPLAISYRRLSEQLDVVGATVTPLLTGATTPTTLGGAEQRSLQASNSRVSLESAHGQGSFFVPDYTVEIAADTSYLKITRIEYLAALRASLVERNSGSHDQLESPRPARGPRSQRSSSTLAPPLAGIVHKPHETNEGPR